MRRALIVSLSLSVFCRVALAQQRADATVPRFDVVSVNFLRGQSPRVDNPAAFLCYRDSSTSVWSFPAPATESAGSARYLPPRLPLAIATPLTGGETQVIRVDDPFERRDQRRPKNAMQAHHEGAAPPPAGKINVFFASTAGVAFFRASERDRRR